MPWSLEVLEVLLQPLHGLGVEVVGRLVEEQHVGIGEQQAADRHAAALAAGEDGHLRVLVRTVHRRHRALHLVLDVPEVLRVDLLLQTLHLGRGLRVVEVAVRVDLLLQTLHLGRGLRVVEVAAEVLVALDLRLRVRDGLLYALAHRF